MEPERTPESEGLPPEFLTFEGRPFETCIDCGRALAATGSPYAIQRVLADDEVLFEFALCTGCMERLATEFSLESMERMQARLRAADVVPRGFRCCAVCGRDGGPCPPRRNLIGIVFEGRLLEPPSVVCEACHEAMESDLSKHTRDVWGDFVTKNFPGVPAHLDPSLAFPAM